MMYSYPFIWSAVMFSLDNSPESATTIGLFRSNFLLTFSRKGISVCPRRCPLQKCGILRHTRQVRRAGLKKFGVLRFSSFAKLSLSQVIIVKGFKVEGGHVVKDNTYFSLEYFQGMGIGDLLNLIF